MSKEKFHSLEKRKVKMQEDGEICMICEERPPVIFYQGKYWCNECLNPDPGIEYHKRQQHHWCGMKSHMGGI